MSPPARSLHRDITHKPCAKGLGHRHPCRAVVARSLHREFHGPHVARRHGFRDALATSRPRAPAGPAPAGRPRRAWRSSSGLVRLHKRARASGERSVQQQASCGGRMRRAHRMAGKMSVPRRPSALLRHRHAARCQHTAHSCRRRSARRQQQHVRAVVLAPPGGLLRPWTDGHVAGRHSHHVCSHCC